MNPLNPLNAKDLKRLNEALKEQFGMTHPLSGVFFQGANDKIYLSTRAIERIPLDSLRIDSLGLYFGTWMRDGFRPSIEGSQIIARNATIGLLTLNRQDWEAWLKGHDQETEMPDAYYLIIHEGNCYGCTKASKGKLLNYVPKARRLTTINA